MMLRVLALFFALGTGVALADAPPAAGPNADKPPSAQVVDRDAIRPNELVGKVVVDRNGNRLGKIENVVLNGADHQADRAIVRSGGFLGFGGKLIAIDIATLERTAAGQTLTATGLTVDQADKLAEFKYETNLKAEQPQ